MWIVNSNTMSRNSFFNILFGQTPMNNGFNSTTADLQNTLYSYKTHKLISNNLMDNPQE